MNNQKTNRSVFDAVNGVVYWDVTRAVNGAVDDAIRWDVDDAVRGDVYWAVTRAKRGAVSGAAGDAVWGAWDGDSFHPGLQDFLLVMREAS